MKSTDAQRRLVNKVRLLPLVTDAMDGIVDGSVQLAVSSEGRDGFAPRTLQRSTDDGRGTSSHGHGSFGCARLPNHGARIWLRGRHRLPWLLLALGMHGSLLTLFLLSKPEEPSFTAPLPIQTQIITEPRVSPTPPPLTPVSLTRPPVQIVVPAPLISIPEVSTVSASTEPAPRAAVVVPTSGNTAPAPPAPVSPPKFDAAYLHNPAPEYPFQARRLREQGTVMLRVEVSTDGGALQVLIEHTSGWPALDHAALAVVRRWRFEPAREGHTAVAAWVLVPIEFDLRS